MKEELAKERKEEMKEVLTEVKVINAFKKHDDHDEEKSDQTSERAGVPQSKW